MKAKNNSATKSIRLFMAALLVTVINLGSMSSGRAETSAVNDKVSVMEQLTPATEQMLSNPTFWTDYLKDNIDTGTKAQPSAIDEMVNDSLYWQKQIRQFIESEQDTATRA